MTIRALLLTLIFATPLAAQTMAFNPDTGESWVIRDAQMPFLCAQLPADGVSTPPTTLPPRTRHLRILKAQRIVATFAGYSGRSSFLPYVEDLIDYCAEVAEKNGEPGFAATWYWALVYGYANFGLRCYSIARYSGSADCSGPFDVKKEPHVIDPIANMKHHVDEQFLGWQKGYRGIDLCKYVMLPSAPRDWGGGMFAKTDRKFRACIQRGYEVGKLR